MTQTVVHLVRHGQVHNPDSIRYGQLPGFRLSTKGQHQARAAASTLKSMRMPVAAVVSSPLDRAKETAELIGHELALPLAIDKRLIESPTDFDGLPKLAVLYPTMWPRFWNPFTPSWGEPFTSIRDRMRAVIDEQRAAHAGASVVLVSHQAPIWVTRHSYERSGPPWLSRMRCTHASITSLHFAGDHFERSTYWAPSRLSMLFR